jgi:hypothetical protein
MLRPQVTPLDNIEWLDPQLFPDVVLRYAPPQPNAAQDNGRNVCNHRAGPVSPLLYLITSPAEVRMRLGLVIGAVATSYRDC